MLNVPQLNFGVAPVVQLPTGMGATGNAFLNAAKMRQDRADRQAAIQRQQDQQNFQNDLASKNLSLRQAEDARRQKEFAQTSQINQMNFDTARENKQRLEAQRNVLKSILPQLEGAKTPEEKEDLLVATMGAHPEAFSYGEVHNALRTQSQDKLNRDKFEQQKELNAARLKNTKLQNKFTLARIAKLNQAAANPQVPFPAQIKYLTDAMGAAKQNYELINDQYNKTQQDVDKAKMSIIGALKNGSVDAAIAVANKSDMPDLSAYLNMFKGKKISETDYVKKVNEYFLNDKEKKLKGLREQRDHAQKQYQALNKSVMMSNLTGRIQPVQFEALPQKGSSEPHPFLDVVNHAIGVASDLGHKALLEKNLENRANSRPKEVFNKINAELEKEQNSQRNIPVDTHAINVPNTHGQYDPSLYGFYPPQGVFNKINAELEKKRNSQSVDNNPSLMTDKALMENPNSYPPFGSGYQDRFRQTFIDPAVEYLFGNGWKYQDKNNNNNIIRYAFETQFPNTNLNLF